MKWNWTSFAADVTVISLAVFFFCGFWGFLPWLCDHPRWFLYIFGAIVLVCLGRDSMRDSSHE